MTEQARGKRVHEKWATFRFSVIGLLLAAPPRRGELTGAITALAERSWQHPISGAPTRFGFSTIECWYYRALKERSDPVGVLRRKLRADAGRQPAISDAVRQALIAPHEVVEAILNGAFKPTHWAQQMLPMHRYTTYPQLADECRKRMHGESTEPSWRRGVGADRLPAPA